MNTVYNLGRWGTLNKKGLFFPNFVRSKHVKPAHKLQYNPDYRIHVSFDFNVNPYMSGLVMQEVPQKGYWNGFKEWVELRIIDEICNEAPFNTGQGLGQTFAARYPVNTGFFMYGDASGKHQSGIQGIMNVRSLFDDVKLGLGNLKGYMKERIPSANPRYKAISKGALGRHAFMIRLLSGNVPVRVLVSDKCKNTILDFQECKVDSDGSMKKEKDSDGVEQRGHLADCFMYTTCHPDLYGKYANIDFKF